MAREGSDHHRQTKYTRSIERLLRRPGLGGAATGPTRTVVLGARPRVCMKGQPFGWNIGYGIQRPHYARLREPYFYKNKAHKLAEVTFHIDTTNYTAPWKFTSSDGRFEIGLRAGRGPRQRRQHGHH